MSRPALIATFVSAALVLALVSASTMVSATHSPSLIGLLAIDANVEGNTATSIGPVNGCARVEPGAQIDVDYVVDAIPEDRPIIAVDVELRYNPDLLEIVGIRHDLMLAAVGDYQPFDAGDPLPNTDDSFHLVVLDVASQSGLPEANQPEANVERGKGVLARITLRAKAQGVSPVTVGYEPQGSYPTTLDSQSEVIIVDKIGGASIAIGQDCPPAAVAPQVIDPPNTEAEIVAGVPAVAVPAAEPDAGQAPAEGSTNLAGAGTSENPNPVAGETEAIPNAADSTDAEDPSAAEDKPPSITDQDAAGSGQDSRFADQGDDGFSLITLVLGGLAVAAALSGGIIYLVIRKSSREAR